MAEDVERRIDELYATPLDRFIPERDAVAKELRAAGDDLGAKRVKALRKPVVAAWALNALAREEPTAVSELLELGTRLREAQRRAVSGGDAEALRAATEERRRTVARLARTAASILEREGTGSGPHEDDITSTLDAALVDEEAGEELRAGRLTKPLRPPVSFGGPGLRVIEGGKRRAEPEPEEDEAERARERHDEVKALRRELALAERREKSAAAALAKARQRHENLERERVEARETLRTAERDHRAAEQDLRRLASRIQRLDRT